MIPNMKILVVEDFRSTRMQEVRILQELGFSDILEADDGQSAILILKAHKDIGLIISDWNMPKMSGLELLHHIRSDENLKSIPFVMATAQGETRAQNEAKEAGASGFVTKPFTADDLKPLIGEVLVKSGTGIRDVTAKHPTKKTRLRAAHIQITDHLALGVLNHQISAGKRSPNHFALETVCMSGWNPVRNALEKREVDAAFILAPIAMDLFSAGVPIKLVLFAHKNGSICVRNMAGRDRESLHAYLKSKIFFIPHILSVHHMLADMFLKEIGLKLGPVGKEGIDVFYEVVPPANMPGYLGANPQACGFVVAEPIGTKSVMDGIADPMFLSGELWENHPCCVVVFRDEFVDSHPDAVFEFVEMLIESGRFIANEPEVSAKIAVDFLDPRKALGLKDELIIKVLKEPKGIKTDDMFPDVGDLDKIQRYMSEKMGIGSLIDPEKFVDARFANQVAGIREQMRRVSKMLEPAKLVAGMINHRLSIPVKENERDNPNAAALTIPEQENESIDITRDEASVHFRISSHMHLVDLIAQKSRDFLRDLGFGIFSEFKLVLRELLINAIEHGNKKDPVKQVVCDVSQVKGDLFKITVTDQGNGFDFHRIPKFSKQENARGRGYPIIHEFSERVIFTEKGRRVAAYVRIRQETTFHVGEENGWKIVRPSGDITATVANTLRELVNDLVENGHKKVTFDIGNVEDMDSVGLSVFIILNKMRTERDMDIDIKIINTREDVMNLFRTTRLHTAFHITGLERGGKDEF